MPSFIPDAQRLSEIFSNAIAPTFFLGAVAAFVSLMTARLSAVIERIRTLNAIAAEDHARARLNLGPRPVSQLLEGDLTRACGRRHARPRQSSPPPAVPPRRPALSALTLSSVLQQPVDDGSRVGLDAVLHWRDHSRCRCWFSRLWLFLRLGRLDRAG